MPIPDTFSSSPAIDFAHLTRQTMGDSSLANELLALFDPQLARLANIIASNEPFQVRSDAAHTLKGSARSMGAWHLADTAEAIEKVLGVPEKASDLALLLENLDRNIRQVKQAIQERSF